MEGWGGSGGGAGQVQGRAGAGPKGGTGWVQGGNEHVKRTRHALHDALHLAAVQLEMRCGACMARVG